MARYRRTRKYYKSKGRWSTNIKNIQDEQTIQQGWNGNAIDLCINPAQDTITNLGVSQQYTVKNVELSAYLECNTSADTSLVESIEHYIMFVPQGMAIGVDYNLLHPEYIMAYYYQGNPTQDGVGLGYKVKVRTRLARRLNTGDRIIYFYKVRKQGENTAAINVSGLVRWWTKAN